MKKCMLLLALIVNMMPCFRGNQVCLCCFEANAQTYMAEMLDPPPLNPTDPCRFTDVTIGSNMNINIIHGYSEKPWCGILVVAAISHRTPESVAAEYAESKGISVSAITGTQNEASFYPSFGVNIGQDIPKDHCSLLHAIKDNGSSCGIFITQSEHVLLIYETQYYFKDPNENAVNFGIAWKYDTNSYIRSSCIQFDDIWGISGTLNIIH